MIPEIGHFSLIFAIFVAFITGILGLTGGQLGTPCLLLLPKIPNILKRDRTALKWQHVGSPLGQTLVKTGTQALWLLTTLSFFCLLYAFYTNDFSVLSVAQHSNTALPDIYRMAAIWGGHEGSLLLWLLILCTWMMAVSLFSRQMPPVMVSYILGVMALLAFGFLLLTELTSNPFVRLQDIPDNGRDLNPLLQDPWFIFHPPLLYMGYVGLSIPFAFSMAALALGRIDTLWVCWVRPWTTVAWICLTLGIASGSWWAYSELGWGGWWFWDPVENASFLPWLVSTALIHTLAVTEKRGLMSSWTILLSLVAFSLCLLSTFLVRSGILTSVHAFTSDPRRGIFILLFLSVVAGSSLVLFARRAHTLHSDGHMGWVSRETFLLMNATLLAAAAATVLLGTLYPLMMNALDLGQLSVGPPYFNRVFTPLMMPVLFLMAVGSCAYWQHDSVARLTQHLWPVGMVSVMLGCVAPWLAGLADHGSILAALALSLAAWIVLASFLQMWQQFKTMPLSLWGMHVAHIGMAICVVGIAMVMTYETSKNVRMAVGDTVSIGGYTLRLTGIHKSTGHNFNADIGTLELIHDNKILGIMRPEKRYYFSSSMPMTEAAIDSGLTGDVYVSLGEALNHPPAWAIRVHYKPFVVWIWGGCLFMALGGMVAVGDKRYHKNNVTAP